MLACATGVDQDVGDPPGATAGSGGIAGTSATQGGGTAGSGSGGTAGSGSGGMSGTTAGTAGTANAFGGTSSTAGTAGAASAGASTGGGGASSGGSGSAGTGAGGKGGGAGTAGTANAAGAGGSATGGGGAGGAGTSGGGGTSGAGTSGTGTGGSGAGTGDCAEAGSGWVVQFWSTTSAPSMPGGNVRILNNSAASVNFTALELRHYFTNEETATLSFLFPTFAHNFPTEPYYEDEHGENVLSSLVTMPAPETNASHYISIKFNSTPGNLGNDEWAVLGYYGSLSMYPVKSNQANDYTYVGHPTADPGAANENVGWDRMTLYVSGQLVWGCEP